MKKKIIFILILLSIVSLFVGAITVQATDVEGVISSMSGSSDMAAETSGGIGTAINDMIGLLQIAGTGIALVVITMLGIKYMLASPSEKADTKKQIMPILIGCILVFGAVNIVAAITDFSSVIDEVAG